MVVKEEEVKKVEVKVKKTLKEKLITNGIIAVKTPVKAGLETEVFGTWSVRLRNFCGVLSVATCTVIANVGMWTVYESVMKGYGWPDKTTMFLIVVGPILVNWTYMNADKTIRTIISAGRNTGKLKEKITSLVKSKMP